MFQTSSPSSIFTPKPFFFSIFLGLIIESAKKDLIFLTLNVVVGESTQLFADEVESFFSWRSVKVFKWKNHLSPPPSFKFLFYYCMFGLIDSIFSQVDTFFMYVCISTKALFAFSFVFFFLLFFIISIVSSFLRRHSRVFFFLNLQGYRMVVVVVAWSIGETVFITKCQQFLQQPLVVLLELLSWLLFRFFSYGFASFAARMRQELLMRQALLIHQLKVCLNHNSHHFLSLSLSICWLFLGSKWFYWRKKRCDWVVNERS